jgi:hypothetical protein
MFCRCDKKEVFTMARHLDLNDLIEKKETRFDFCILK